jgi:hypothetical protein
VHDNVHDSVNSGKIVFGLGQAYMKHLSHDNVDFVKQINGLMLSIRQSRIPELDRYAEPWMQ